MKLTKAIKITALLAITGISIALLIHYVESNILKTYENNLPLIALGDNVKNRSTRAHLWFEELMAGDESINYQKDVKQQFKSCMTILQGAYSGKHTEIGTFIQSTDHVTLQVLEESIESMETLLASAEERWYYRNKTLKGDSLSGEEAGGVLDQNFDMAYDDFQAKMDKLVTHVNAIVNADTQFLNKLAKVSVAAVLVIFSLICFAMFRSTDKADGFAKRNEEKLHKETSRVAELNRFVELVSNGNFQSELNLEENDNLGSALVRMRDKLRNSQEEEGKRSWVNAGLAQIGTILRNTDSDLQTYYDSIIRFIVTYTKNVQGGLYILNNDNGAQSYLEMVSCYAYDRKKFQTKQILPGEGLVGQVFMEGTTTYMLEVPKTYVQITSGLGHETPRMLVLIPLVINEKTFGVLEIAGFKALEKYEVEFLERLAENIASSIASAKANAHTRKLLEITQQQAEEMRAQEEEMRQNMEELTAIQEEMTRKEKAYLERIAALEQKSLQVVNW